MTMTMTMMMMMMMMMMIPADILQWSGYHQPIQGTLAADRALWRSRRTGAGRTGYCWSKVKASSFNHRFVTCLVVMLLTSLLCLSQFGMFGSTPAYRTQSRKPERLFRTAFLNLSKPSVFDSKAKTQGVPVPPMTPCFRCPFKSSYPGQGSHVPHLGWALGACLATTAGFQPPNPFTPICKTRRKPCFSIGSIHALGA